MKSAVAFHGIPDFQRQILWLAFDADGLAHAYRVIATPPARYTSIAECGVGAQPVDAAVTVERSCSDCLIALGIPAGEGPIPS